MAQDNTGLGKRPQVIFQMIATPGFNTTRVIPPLQPEKDNHVTGQVEPGMQSIPMNQKHSSHGDGVMIKNNRLRLFGHEIQPLMNRPGVSEGNMLSPMQPQKQQHPVTRQVGPDMQSVPMNQKHSSQGFEDGTMNNNNGFRLFGRSIQPLKNIPGVPEGSMGMGGTHRNSTTPLQRSFTSQQNQQRTPRVPSDRVEARPVLLDLLNGQHHPHPSLQQSRPKIMDPEFQALRQGGPDMQSVPINQKHSSEGFEDGTMNNNNGFRLFGRSIQPLKNIPGLPEGSMGMGGTHRNSTTPLRRSFTSQQNQQRTSRVPSDRVEARPVLLDILNGQHHPHPSLQQSQPKITDPEFQALRRSILKKIRNVLLTMKRNTSENTSEAWRQQLPEIAKRIEESMRKDFPDKENYNSIPHDGVMAWIMGMLAWIMGMPDYKKQRRDRQLHQQQLKRTPGISHDLTGRGRVSVECNNSLPSVDNGVQAVPSEGIQGPNTTHAELILQHARSCHAPVGHCPGNNCDRGQKIKHRENCHQDQCGLPNCLVRVPGHKVQSAAKQKAFYDKRDANRVLMDLSKGRHQPHQSSEESLPKRLKINMGASAVRNDTTNRSFNAVEEVFPTERSAPSLKYSGKDLNQPDWRDGATDLMDVSQVHQQLYSPPQQSLPKELMMYTEACVHPANPSFSAIEENFPTEQRDNDAEEMVHEVNQGISVVVENEESSSRSACKAILEEGTKEGTASKAEKRKLTGVSLVDHFTLQQVTKHISSLRQGIDQSKPKVEQLQVSENSCQLCGVANMAFEPTPIYCTPCQDRIKRNVIYYSLNAGEHKYVVCMTCYNASRGKDIKIGSCMVPKARFEKKKNDEEVKEEEWVQCDKCDMWQHQICALFNERRNIGDIEYICPKCYMGELEKNECEPLPESAMLRAEDLPPTKLSNFIEDRLSKQLHKERQERANSLGKKLEEVPGVEGLVLRVVSSVDKILQVKSRFCEIFHEENYPTKFPYRSKMALLFQKIEGADVCLFAMYVHEFGTECALPNQRRLYLSYLDSVKYFRPDIKTINGEALRTFVYHEILVGYLEYSKNRGFISCSIWACPPPKGEDYILYCHPEIQMTPKSSKLREWYLSMLKKGRKDNIVIGLTNLYDHFFKQQGKSAGRLTAARLPYFDGDYLPEAAEYMIKQLLREDDLKQQKGNTGRSAISKRTFKAGGHNNLSDNASKDAMLMKLLGKKICPMKEDFIMVHLQHVCSHCSDVILCGTCWVCSSCGITFCESCYPGDERESHLTDSNEEHKHAFSLVEITGLPADTKDTDSTLESKFFETRHAFLSLCQDKYYQFNTLRNAKHSSMMVLWHLHNPTMPIFN